MKTSQRIYLPFKRLIGIIGSLVGMIVCFVFLWLWIIPVNAIVTKGHPFFAQKRIGRNKKIFKIYKFRTMRNDVNPNIIPSEIDTDYQNSLRTKFGKFLRITSLDETLQIFNILFGQMAFIGPRPGNAVNEEYLVICREKFMPNAFLVRPGISGYAQINMKRSHDPELKARYDHEYVVKLSFWLDVKIFVTTVLKIFSSGKGN